MDSSRPPNIDIKSNILPIKTPRPFADNGFMARIVAYSALVKFKKIGFPYRVELTRAQKDILNASTCAFIYNGQRVRGLVRRGSKYFMAVRCHKRRSCKYAEKAGCLNPDYASI